MVVEDIMHVGGRECPVFDDAGGGGGLVGGDGLVVVGVGG